MFYNAIARQVQMISGNTPTSCAQSFSFCAATVTASAFAGHASCVAADLIPAVGILCHASVIALQVIGNQECSNSYKDCMGNQSSGAGGQFFPGIGWVQQNDADIVSYFYY